MENSLTLEEVGVRNYSLYRRKQLCLRKFLTTDSTIGARVQGVYLTCTSKTFFLRLEMLLNRHRSKVLLRFRPNYSEQTQKCFKHYDDMQLMVMKLFVNNS